MKSLYNITKEMLRLIFAGLALLMLNPSFAVTRKGGLGFGILSRGDLDKTLVTARGLEEISREAAIKQTTVANFMEQSIATSRGVATNPLVGGDTIEINFNFTGVGNGASRVPASLGAGSDSTAVGGGSNPAAAALTGEVGNGKASISAASGEGASRGSAAAIVADAVNQPNSVSIPKEFVPGPGSNYSELALPTQQNDNSLGIAESSKRAFSSGINASVPQIANDAPVFSLNQNTNPAPSNVSFASNDIAPPIYRPVYNPEADKVFGTAPSGPLANTAPAPSPGKPAEALSGTKVAKAKVENGNSEGQAPPVRPKVTEEKQMNSETEKKTCAAICESIKNDSNSYRIKVSQISKNNDLTTNFQFELTPIDGSTSPKWQKALDAIEKFKSELKTCTGQTENSNVLVRLNFITVGMKSECFTDLQAAERAGIFNRWDSGAKSLSEMLEHKKPEEADIE